MSEVHTLHVDGGARGNPGPAGAGIVLRDEQGGTVCAAGSYLGTATNNVAEYEALIWGLTEAASRGIRRLRVYGDSELVVKQMNGAYRVKHPNLKPLFVRAQSLRRSFDSVEFNHVRREHNADADALANEAMDALADVGDAVRPDACGSAARLFEEDS